MKEKHTTILSFKHAFDGLSAAYKNEPHLRIHVILAFVALIGGFIFKISQIEWIVIISAIFYVISLELINTVIESLVNLVSPQIRPEAKIAKDVSASVVLSAAIYSVIVGIIIFLPKIYLLLN